MPSLLYLKKSASDLYQNISAHIKRWFYAGNPVLKLWFALYLTVISGGLEILWIYVNGLVPSLRTELLPAYKNDVIKPNVHLLEYAFLVIGVGGCLALYWLQSHLPNIGKCMQRLAKATFFAALCIFVLSHPHLPDLVCVVAMLLSYSCIEKPDTILKRLPTRLYFRCLLLLPFFAIVFFFVKSWYPLIIPADYYELPDRIKTEDFLISAHASDPSSLSRAEAMACIDASEPTDKVTNTAPKKMPKTACPLARPYEINAQAAQSLGITGGAETQVGRVLYHHSYIYVPARHMELYGITKDVPAIYGLLHTALYAWLMSCFGDGIGQYFNYYFYLILVGVALIGGTVYGVTKNWFALLSATAISFGYFFSIPFDATLLAQSFSPLRHAGILLQIASIFVAARREDWLGIVFIWLALILSIAWNTEFAAFGFAGQMLYLISPSVKLKTWPKFLLLIIFFATLVFLEFCVFSISPNLLHGNVFTFFGVASTSYVTLTDLTRIVIYVMLLTIIFAYCAQQLSSAERDARLCVLSILALCLLKYFFVASVAHLDITLAFIVPLLLIYYPFWNTEPRGKVLCMLPIDPRLIIYAVGIVFCVNKAISYHSQSEAFRHNYLSPYVINQWTDLDKTVHTPMPEASLARRVEAIKNTIKTNDTVLLLSPFDHLLSYYVIPRRFCGHFELLTNLIRRQDFLQVERCAEEQPNVLVIYDKALEMPCPSYSSDYVAEAACAKKWELKRSLVEMRDQLLPNLTPVKETDDLIIYRVNPKPHEEP